jgi:glycosyl transferase family 2
MRPGAMVGIPTYNGHRRVLDLLENLRQRTSPAVPHTIVVCDDSGKDAHRSQVREACLRYGATYIQNERNRGVAASWNALVRSTDHEMAVLLNDDVLVAKDWLEYLHYAVMENPRVGSVSLNCLFIEAKDAAEILKGPDARAVPLNVRYRDGVLIRNERYTEMPKQGDGAPGRVMCPSGCAFGFRREAYDRIGGFDERFFAFYEESVPGQEVVLIRDATRGTRLVTMRELYEQYALPSEEGDRAIVRPVGLECLSAKIGTGRDAAFLTVRETEVLSMERTTTSTLITVKNRAMGKIETATRVEGEWAPVTGIVRHRRRNKILHVRQKAGSVLVTENHSMVLQDGETFNVVEPRVFSSETLPRAQVVPLAETRTAVDLGAFLVGWDQYRQDHRSMWYLMRKSNGKLSDALRSPGVPRWLDLLSRDGQEFCWLLGFHVAEGSVSVTDNYGALVISLACNADRSLLERSAEIWRRVVGTRTYVVESVQKEGPRRGWKPNYKLCTGHKLVGLMLMAMCGKGAHNKRVPDFLYDAPEACKEAFLAGYVAGDGLVVEPRSSRAESRSITHVETVSRNLAAGLAILLAASGKRFSLQYRAKFRSYVLRTVNQFVGHRDTKVVEEIGDESEFVYDIEVQGNHVFCAGVGPVVIHNTDFGVACAYHGMPAFTLPVPQDNYHIWSATFGSAPEINAARVMAESRAKFLAKWSATLGRGFGDAPDIHPVLMDKIPKFPVRWLGVGKAKREETL